MRGFRYLEGRDFGFEARYANEDVTRLSRLVVLVDFDLMLLSQVDSPCVSLETGNLHPSDCWSYLSNPVGLA